MGCVTCEVAANCTNCNTSYYMHENQCLACGSNCNSCVDNENCKTCDVTYYNNDGICTSCPNYCESCSMVNSSLICSSCRPGFYLLDGGSNVTCGVCPRGCKNCSNNTSCEECFMANAFYNVGMNQC